MNKCKKKHRGHGMAGLGVILENHPEVKVKEVLDTFVLEQERLIGEVKKQCKPVMEKGLVNGKELISRYTARAHGLKEETIRRQLNEARKPSDFIKGANPQGKVKEVVAAYEYRKMQEGRVHNHVKDIVLAPDEQCKRDLLFKIDIGNEKMILKPGPQVKTGGAQYVADSICDMAQKEGYGKTAVVDGRYANADNTPRAAPDAFTPKQAEKIKQAGVRLKGIKDLDKRGEALLENIEAIEKDGLTPVQRTQLQKFREDIAKAYSEAEVGKRIKKSTALGFATAALLSIIVQYRTEGKVEVVPVLKEGAKSACVAGGNAWVDAKVYQYGLNKYKQEELAKAFAKETVTLGFCLVAVATDTVGEVKAACKGEIEALDALAGIGLKGAIDLLPVLLAPLGIAGMPISVGMQIGGRWVLSEVRQFCAEMDEDIESYLSIGEDMKQRTQQVEQLQEEMEQKLKEMGLI